MLYRRAGRRATATAEFAIIVPFFASVLLGTFELSRGLWAKEILSDAARRACRTGSLPGTSSATIISDVNNILTDNKLDPSSATITVLVNGQAVDASTAQQNDKISVKVAYPVSKIMIVTAVFLKSSMVESETVVMMRYDQ
jgi:Flp pilus assembly protein TadG